MITICLVGEAARNAAEHVCVKIRSALETSPLSAHHLNLALKELFAAQPLVALDAFFLPCSPQGNLFLFSRDFGMGTPIDKVDSAILQQWADQDPENRYPALGKCIPMFLWKNHEETEEISPRFLTMLALAPNKKTFLGGLWDRIHPRGSSSSLASALLRRKAQLIELAGGACEQVRAWVAEMMPGLDQMIEHAHKREQEREESFE